MKADVRFEQGVTHGRASRAPTTDEKLLQQMALLWAVLVANAAAQTVMLPAAPPEAGLSPLAAITTMAMANHGYCQA